MNTDAKSGTRWGEDKPVFEDGLIGGLATAAVGAALGAVMMPGGALYALAARLGVISDASAMAYFWTDPLMLAFGGLLPIAGAVGGFALGFSELARQASQWHFDGMEFVTERLAGIARMQANETALMSPEQQAGEVRGIEVAGVELSRTREVGHISLVGLPGAGKTVMVNGIVQQVRARGEKLILHSPKGDFEAWLYGPGCVLLGPWDARAHWWDIAADVDTPEAAATFAGAMFPSDGGANQYFSDAARELLAGVLKCYMRRGTAWGWDTLAADLSSDPGHIIDLAHEGDPQTQVLVPAMAEGEDMTNATKGVLSSLALATSWIPAYAASFDIQRDAGGQLDTSRAFSIREWLAGHPDYAEVETVILNNDKRFEIRAQQIFGAIVAAAANYINSSAMPEVGADAPGLWVVLDEYPQLGNVVAKYVQQIEEMGRSRGVRVVKAVQDESQLFAAVGREKGEAQRSVQQTRIYCKLATGTAAELAQRLGEREVIRIEFPQAVGAGNKRATTQRLPVIRSSELTGLRILKDGETPGVEVVIHTDDLLCKLVHPFATVVEVAPKVIENEKWRRGVLGMPSAARFAAPTGAAMAALAQGDALGDADLPFDFGPEQEADHDENEAPGAAGDDYAGNGWDDEEAEVLP